jgi:hypothetical protein
MARRRHLYDVTIPGQHETGLALPWGGTSHPVWFKRDPRVANVKVLGGVFNRPLMLGVPQIVKAVLEQIEGLPEAEKLRVLTEQAAGVMNQMPPRETPGSTPRWTRCTPPVRSAARTA